MTKRRVPIGAAVFGVLSLAVYGLLAWVVLGDREGLGSEAVHVAGAITFFAIVVAGVVSAVVSPAGNGTALRQVAAAAMALLVVALIVGDPDNYGGQAGPFDVTYLLFLVPPLLLVLVHPARREMFKAREVRPLLLMFAAVVTIPLVLEGVDQALLQRNSWPPKSDPHHNSHWFTMGQLAFAIPLLAFSAGLGGRGWRLAGWSAAAALAVLGVASLAVPDAASSFGLVWAVGALVAAGGLAWLLVKDVGTRSSEPVPS